MCTDGTVIHNSSGANIRIFPTAPRCPVRGPTLQRHVSQPVAVAHDTGGAQATRGRANCSNARRWGHTGDARQPNCGIARRVSHVSGTRSHPRAQKRAVAALEGCNRPIRKRQMVRRTAAEQLNRTPHAHPARAPRHAHPQRTPIAALENGVGGGNPPPTHGSHIRHVCRQYRSSFTRRFLRCVRSALRDVRRRRARRGSPPPRSSPRQPPPLSARASA